MTSDQGATCTSGSLRLGLPYRMSIERVPEDPCIIASGPLTADDLAKDIARLTGQQHLYFYDAISPIVEADTIDMSIAFRQSRYNKSVGSTIAVKSVGATLAVAGSR